MRVVLVLTLVLLSACSVERPSTSNINNYKGIANGNIVPFRDYPKYGAILALQVGESLCTASHLKGRFILTAWHCIGMQIRENGGEKLDFKVTSPSGPTRINVSASDYRVRYATTSQTEEIGENKVPVPDVAIIELTNAPEEFLALPTAGIPSETASEGDAGFMIAGFGDDSLEGPGMAGRLNAARGMKIAESTNLYHFIQWDLGSDSAAALPGDSGGPLFRFSVDGKIVVYGVASTLHVEANELEGSITSTKNRYVRVDGGAVRKWIIGVITE